MPLINGRKYSCEPCVRGHRATSCAHTDRVLVEVRKPGRPLQTCGHKLASCTCGRVAETFAIENVLPPEGTGDVMPRMATPRPRPIAGVKGKPKSRPRSHSRQSKRASSKVRTPGPAATIEQEDKGGESAKGGDGQIGMDIERQPSNTPSNTPSGEGSEFHLSPRSTVQLVPSYQTQQLPRLSPQHYGRPSSHQSPPNYRTPLPTSSTPPSISSLLNEDFPPSAYELPPIGYMPSSATATSVVSHSHGRRHGSLSYQVSQNVYGNSNTSRSPTSWQQQPSSLTSPRPESRMENVSMVPGTRSRSTEQSGESSSPQTHVRSQYIATSQDRSWGNTTHWQ